MKVLALLAVCTSASGPSQDVLIRYKFKQGAVLHYTTSIKMDFQTEQDQSGTPTTTEMDASFKATQKIKSVAKDGSAVLVVTVDSMTEKFNGQSMTYPKSSPQRIRMTATGNADLPMSASASSDDGSRGAAVDMMQVSNMLPAAAVHPGSTWTGQLRMGGIGNSKVNCTLQKFAQVKGSQLAYIAMKGKMNGSSLGGMFPGGALSGLKMSGSIDYTMIVIFNVSRGVLESQSATSDFDMYIQTKDPNTQKATEVHLTGTQVITQTKS